MANFNQGTGEHRQNISGNKGAKNALGNTGTKCSEREDKKKNDVKALILGHFFCTHVVNIFVSKSVCMALQQWFNWGIIMSYEFTLGGRMLSEIINRLVGRRSTVACEIAVTTYTVLYTEYGAKKSGQDRGFRSNHLN